MINDEPVKVPEGTASGSKQSMPHPASETERRANPQLRVIFVQACELLKPFFDPANRWGGQNHEHLAYRSLHEQFPSLSTQEAFVLVSAARRVFSTTGRPAAPGIVPVWSVDAP
jgi:hypothetical protein